MVDITDCSPGLIHTGEIGVLRNDIVCETSSIVLDANAKLDLAGYTITKVENLATNLPGWAQENAVYCRLKCSIFSSTEAPGLIVGPGPGIGDAIYGIEGGTYYDNTSCKRMRVENVEVAGFDRGISAGDARMFLFDVNLHDNGSGAVAERLVAKRVEADDNGDGIGASRVKVRDFVCSRSSQDCVSGNWTKVQDALLADSNIGVWGRHMRVIDTAMTGNTLDILSENFPRLKGSTCDTSQRFNVDPPQSWGVCSLD